MAEGFPLRSHPEGACCVPLRCATLATATVKFVDAVALWPSRVMVRERIGQLAVMVTLTPVSESLQAQKNTRVIVQWDHVQTALPICT